MELYVWGTGCSAGELTERGLSPGQITAFVDSFPRSGSFLGRPVLRPEVLRDRPFDLVLVTSRQTEEIAQQAQALGIPEERLLFLKNNWSLQDRNRSYGTAAALLGNAAAAGLRRPARAVTEPLWAGDSPLGDRDLENDYVRVRTLELLCQQLWAVPGAAAELGVYRGGFARCINALLPDRLLYLFDTFTGFDEAEAAGEAAGLVEAHRGAGAEGVLRHMPHPEQVRLRQGLFPATAQGLEERFALVSLDVDLEESTLAGLRWFWPRLQPGGYLLLHDFNSPALPGVARALRRFEAERGERLPAVPICDINGSLVICKYREEET